MNKKRNRIVLLCIIIISVIVVLFPYLEDSFLYKTSTKNGSITLKQGNFTVGKDFSSGIYDIEVIEGSVHFSEISLHQGDKILGIKFYKEGKISIDGNGKVRLEKAKFSRLKKDKNGDYFIQHSGYYRVGKQLQEGKYRLSFVDHEKTHNRKPFVQITSSDGTIRQSYSFEKKNQRQIKLNLKNQEILEIHKGFSNEYQNYVILLHPLSKS
ncbi:hypothetical protein ABER60_01420 [Heyndrickxia coagulans]|uniref:hypothetical protein n=1 Tax=Heyndrickxia coagulans TaxID=1398 RepID=UPI002E1BC986|nr:hypothetical protein [Heyndrickxia coagulans]MED4964947.1 hypothetical protein [Heyndrickxia coagulans]